MTGPVIVTGCGGGVGWRVAASVTAAAARNGAGLRARAAALVAGDATGVLARFRALVAGSVFSTNVAADKVATFAAVGAVVDARTIDQHNAGGDRAAGQRAFRRRQNDYFTRRVRFEAVWRHGRRFVYGAVNAGGMGVEEFGEFCLVVVDPTVAAPDAVAVFPGNSVERYCAPDGVVDIGRARREAASWTDRAELAVVEREAEALSAHEADWPAVVCRPDHFLEVVVGAAVPVGALAEVRVREDYLDHLAEMQALDLAGATLSSTERNEAAAFTAVQGWHMAHGVAITGVR